MRALPTAPMPAGASSLPTFRPGIGSLPTRCPHCSSTWLGYEEPLGQHQRGSVWCETCSRTICWVAAPAPTRPRTSPLLPARALRGGNVERVEPDVIVAARPHPIRAEGFRLTPGCGPTCTREYGHAADVHERYGASTAHTALAARVSGDVATGPLLIQLGPGRVFVDGVETALSAVEYTLLAYLAVRLGDLCWAADILDATWGRGWAATPEYGRQVVRVHVHRLRVKLGAASGLVENEVGRGYRLADAPLS